MTLLEEIKAGVLKYNKSRDKARQLYELIDTELFQLASSSPHLRCIRNGGSTFHDGRFTLQLSINTTHGGSSLFATLVNNKVAINDLVITNINDARTLIRDKVVEWCASYKIRDIER
jgi:hypothetical protein